MTNTDLSNRIQAGAARLDEHFGDRTWVKNINLTKLNLENSRSCVLGQLFAPESSWDDPGYWIGKQKLGLDTHDVQQLGFDRDDARNDYPGLQRAWKKFLRDEQERSDEELKEGYSKPVYRVPADYFHITKANFEQLKNGLLMQIETLDKLIGMSTNKEGTKALITQRFRLEQTLDELGVAARTAE